MADVFLQGILCLRNLLLILVARPYPWNMLFYWETENFSNAVFEWSFTSRDKRRLSVFDNRALKRIFGPKRDEVTRECRKLHNEELNNLYCSPSIVRMINQEECDGWGKWHIWGTGEVYTGFWWGNLRERDHLKDPDVVGRIILR